MKKFKLFFTVPRIIILSFAALIFFGAFLLALPISSTARAWTDFSDALFTATSATCVTGLVVFDTATYWSYFGQAVILILIQIGGIGCMTLISLFYFTLNKRISLKNRMVFMQAAGAIELSDVVRLVKHIVLWVVCAEFVGAVVLCTQFIPAFGWGYGVWASVFTSISAFCNAGFDIFGVISPFCSLTPFASNVVVNLTVCALIIFGGLGFLVWSDLFIHKFRLGKCLLHTKIVLVTSLALILGGWVIFGFSESDAAFAGMSVGDKVLAAFFQSVTTRTAGFNSVPLGELSAAGEAATVAFMFIGGSPGSTAGGIKTTTFTVAILAAFSGIKKDKTVTAFKKRLDESTVKQAFSVIFLYLAVTVAAVIIIGLAENIPDGDVVFETVSAIATVGLTKGITTSLGTLSEMIIALCMFLGRIGCMTFVLSLRESSRPEPVQRPVGKILIG